MKQLGRVASFATITLALAGAGVVATPAAQAGLGEPTEPPPAYVLVLADRDSCQLASVDLGSGAVTVLSAAPSAEACADDLAVAPDGSVWGIGDGDDASLEAELIHYDATTGEVLTRTAIQGSFTESGLAFGGLAFDGAGTLYVQLVTDEPGCDGDAVCLYTADPTTAQASFVGAPGADFFATFFAFLAADCGASLRTIGFGALITGADTTGADTSWDAVVPAAPLSNTLNSYDKASGAMTTGGAFPDDLFVVGLDYFRTDGTLYALLAPRSVPIETSDPTTDATAAAGDVGTSAIEVSLYTVDPATVEVTLVAPLSEPDLNLGALAIAGTCPAPPPIELAPTFTG
jgi:hypothetical protein